MEKNNYSKEFNEWAIRYYSWCDTIDPKDLESHWMAWNACKLQVLKIMERHKVNVHVDDEFEIEQDEDVTPTPFVDMDAVKDIEQL